MYFSFAVAAAALLTCTSANLFARQATLPQCVIDCTKNADLGGCQATDNLCLCKSAAFLNSSTLCIGQTCKGSDLTNAIDASKQLCAQVGVTLTSTPVGFPTGTATEDLASTSSPTGTSANSSASTGSPTSSTTPSASASNAASINGVTTLAGFAAVGLAVLAL